MLGLLEQRRTADAEYHSKESLRTAEKAERWSDMAQGFELEAGVAMQRHLFSRAATLFEMARVYRNRTRNRQGSLDRDWYKAQLETIQQELPPEALAKIRARVRRMELHDMIELSLSWARR